MSNSDMHKSGDELMHLPDFDPAAVMFRPDQRGQIIISNVGILLWMAGVGYSISQWGFFEVFRVYLVPYLWCVCCRNVILQVLMSISI